MGCEKVHVAPVPAPELGHGAAVAGVGLFLSGLVSGYFDNQARYHQLASRIAAAPGLVRLGKKRATRFADYIDAHYGAILGNRVGLVDGLLGGDRERHDGQPSRSRAACSTSGVMRRRRTLLRKLGDASWLLAGPDGDVAYFQVRMKVGFRVED